MKKFINLKILWSLSIFKNSDSQYSNKFIIIGKKCMSMLGKSRIIYLYILSLSSSLSSSSSYGPTILQVFRFKILPSQLTTFNLSMSYLILIHYIVYFILCILYFINIYDINVYNFSYWSQLAKKPQNQVLRKSYSDCHIGLCELLVSIPIYSYS